MQAVRAADLDLLDWLLAQEGVNIEGRDKQGNTVLHWSTVHCVSAPQGCLPQRLPACSSAGATL